MELTYDWRSFQSIFPQQRTFASGTKPDASPIFAVTQNDLVLCVFCESEDLSRWVGATLYDLKSEFPGRQVVAFDRDQVEKITQGSLGLPHFYDQVEYLKSEAGAVPGKAQRKGFLLEAIQSWWAKVLPSAYGAFIRLEGEGGGDYFMVVRRGRLEGFMEPDLSTINRERRDEVAEAVKYLSEKYLVPVQGVVVKAEDWKSWSASSTPWKDVALAIKSQRARMVPFRWGITTLIASRAFLRV